MNTLKTGKNWGMESRNFSRRLRAFNAYLTRIIEDISTLRGRMPGTSNASMSRSIKVSERITRFDNMPIIQMCLNFVKFWTRIHEKGILDRSCWRRATGWWCIFSNHPESCQISRKHVMCLHLWSCMDASDG